jgi:hypothetical protein
MTQHEAHGLLIHIDGDLYRYSEDQGHVWTGWKSRVLDAPALRLDRVCGEGALSEEQRQELRRRMLDAASRVTLSVLRPLVGKPLTDTGALR